MKRKKYGKNLKAKVAIAAIKGQKTANEIAAEFCVHVSQVNRWKKQALDTLPDCFGDGREKTLKDMEAERDQLFRQIGKLQVEVDWLKKTPDICYEHQREAGLHRSGSRVIEYSAAM